MEDAIHNSMVFVVYIEFAFLILYSILALLYPAGSIFLTLGISMKNQTPRDFGSFRDKVDIKIDPRENVFPFALNERIAGLQFYQEDGFFRDGTFYLEENLVLDAETSKELGLQGNVVKAGKYPVIMNKENGTFNAILAVEKGFER